MRKYILLTVFAHSFFCLAAQQSSVFTQAADEFGLVNPAGLSIEEMQHHGTIVNLYTRNQWWNFETSGYPQTQVINWLNNNSAQHQYGAMVLSDKVGETRQFGFQGRYAHALTNGLKAGISLGMSNYNINTANLDIYDNNDPLISAVGDPRWRFSVGAGAFYYLFHPNKAWNWYAGASFIRIAFMDKIPESEDAAAEQDFMAQGGLGHQNWWIGGRFRLSLNRPNALDLYLRRYLMDERLFLGVILTSDKNNQTLGGQAGYEWLLKSSGATNNHFITTSFGFSKPLSKYIYGNNLIFDARVTWVWEHE